MGKIKILDDAIVSEFAANELAVNRYYALKELIDNSLDAGATNIEVLYGKSAGDSDFIVRDNGFGMSKSDLSDCYKRFATSKTNDLNDVYSPKLLGYRGEALYSLFQSSKVTIKTREEGEEHAWCISSIDLVIKPCAGEVGTEVKVSGFLSLIPARKATLISSGYERNKIIGFLRDLSVIRPDVHFSFKDGAIHEKFETNSENKYVSRVKDVYNLENTPFSIEAYDDNLSINFVAFESKTNKVCISVNGRIIRSKKISEMLQFFLRSNYGVERANIYLVMNVFENENINYHSCPYKENLFLSKKVINSLEKVLQLNTFNKKDFWSIPSTIEANVEMEDVSYNLLGKIIGQFDNGIILTEVADGLIVIDQHAAYEKIIQEKLLQNLSGRFETVRQIELSHPVKISEVEASSVFIADMAKIGFDIKNKSNSSYLIKMPYFIFPSQDLYDTLAGIIDEDKNSNLKDISRVIFDISNVSCKMALKYGEALTMEEMNLFVREMEKYPSSLVCNHGRPTTKKISKLQLLKEFDRI